jgi:nucleoid DNA-binding protein
MAKQIEPTESIENYLQHKLGISQSLASAFLKAVTEWISIKLRRRENAILPYIGKITLKVTPKAKRMHYSPGKTLQNRINEELSKESLFLASLNAIRIKLGLQQDKENKKQLNKIEEELRTSRRIEIKDPRDAPRYSLIYYYQRGYPHRESWTHPTTHKSYAWETMHSSLCLIKKTSWFDYRLFLTTLVRIDDRRYLLNRWKMTKTDYKRVLHQSLDAVLMLLEFPEMSESELDFILEADRFKL